MAKDTPEKPQTPDLPTYLREPLQRQSPEQLQVVASYATELAEWKRKRREIELERRQAREAVDEGELEDLEERDISTDPEEYDDVPSSGAYITVKTTKETNESSYDYYYWQWREGDTWKNEYIAPVNPRQ